MNTSTLRPHQNIKVKDLMEKDPWTMVEGIIGLQYTGDINFIPHGGTFYDTTNWDETSYGYADALEIYCGEHGTDDHNQVMLYDVTINKLNEAEYIEALHAIGMRMETMGDGKDYIYPEDGEPEGGFLRNTRFDIETTLLHGLRVDKEFLDKVRTRKTDGQIAEYTACRAIRFHLLGIINDI